MKEKKTVRFVTCKDLREWKRTMKQCEGGTNRGDRLLRNSSAP